MRYSNLYLHISGTVCHKLWVAYYLFGVMARLLCRALVHDLSKFTKSESSGFVKVIHRLRESTYGSWEYKDALEEIEPSIKLHYRRNRHHPEYFGGIRGFDLVDLVEMYCDWKAAVRRHTDGDIQKSIKTNTRRFELGEVLADILSNTSKKAP